jgi:hypothetical protein
MTADTVQQLLFFSTASNGLLAGLNADHYIVQVPAWRRRCPESRRSPRGVWPLPAVAESATRGAACAVVGLGLTIFAAPNILRLRHEHDEAAETAAFRRFHAWGLARAVAQVAAFPFTLWALSALPR